MRFSTGKENYLSSSQGLQSYDKMHVLQGVGTRKAKSKRSVNYEEVTID
jgi:hypothetical protein